MKEFLFIALFLQSQPEYSLWVAKIGRNGEAGENIATTNLKLGKKSLIANMFPKVF